MLPRIGFLSRVIYSPTLKQSSLIYLFVTVQCAGGGGSGGGGDGGGGADGVVLGNLVR